MLDQKFIDSIAQEVSVAPEQVATAITFFDGGATIPFVARYRKDATRSLDEVQLEGVAVRNQYFAALTQRRDAILANIEKLDKLTPELRSAIEGCTEKHALEDLYLPFKKKRRTRAAQAREQGLEPLAEFLIAQEMGDKESIDAFALSFVNSEKRIVDGAAALEGARAILSEDMSGDHTLRMCVREELLNKGTIASTSTKNAEEQKTKFEAYYDFKEPLSKIPSHRLLAILRGVKEGVLRMELLADDEALRQQVVAKFVREDESPFSEHIRSAAVGAYDRLMRPSIENEVIGMARKKADEDAIRVFRENAKSLLLAPPAGPTRVIGIDPGLRTGCKLAVIDEQGNFLECATIHPEKVTEASEIFRGLIEKHEAYSIAIGNGTGSREVSRFVRDVLSELKGKIAFWVLVNEAGASVYSASKIAREEFPDLDLTYRGAISIARRLQDPLSELVKLEPKTIGVGQYQHDVNQKSLKEGLHRTVVSCVNQVGVDLNTASIPLLRYVSGIQYGTAQNIVRFRSEHGGFKNREELLNVDGIGPKVFEQCAGFLRIKDGDNPLDRTGVHPEAYGVVAEMAASVELTPGDLVSNGGVIGKFEIQQFVSETMGELMLKDVIAELKRPGRDPRKSFEVPKYIDGVGDVKDLEVGMDVEGIVTNVTDFGAFVDIGVHQDGLVHLSQMANRFVRDPREVASVGQIVKVKVIAVDKDVPRISLSIKALQEAVSKTPRRRARRTSSQGAGKGTNGPSERPNRKQAASQRSGREEGGERKPRRRKPQTSSRNDKPKRSQNQREAVSGDTGSPLNTQLADQLASLKEKFGS